MKQSTTSLQKRIALFFLLVLSIIVVVTLTIVWQTTYNHLTAQLDSQFSTAREVVVERIQNRAKALEADLEPVAKDFTTKKLIASAVQDPSSLRSAMDNFQKNRWKTDIYWVLNPNSEILASSNQSGQLAADVAKMLSTDGIHWYRHDGIFYLMKAMPVRFVELSGKINGWIVTGVKAETLFGDRLVELTNMHVAVFDFADKLNIATTFLGEALEPLSEQENIGKQTLASETYLYTTSELGEWLKTPVYLILAKNEADAYLSNQTLRNELFLVLILAALLAWLAAVLVSRGITRPLEELSRVATNISKGQYSDTFPTSNAREVESLSKAISDMQDGIFDREKEINALAFFDELTGLPNRLQFNQHLANLINKQVDNHFIVLTLDVDRFKEINDTVGHETGDTLLQLISQRLALYTAHNPFFARLSGDEFAVVLDNQSAKYAEKAAIDLVALFEQSFRLGELVLDIDCSIGAAVYPDDATTYQGILQCADIAMYSCKEQHYRYAVYTDSLNKYSVMRLNLMSELKGALKEGQLQLYYQPKLSFDGNAINTVECLIRWIHPEHGFVSPDEFIPLAEQTGAIRNVTNWALDVACREVSIWQSQGMNLGVAVNISAMDLVDMCLPTYIAELLTRYNLTADLLTLEVTESAVMSNPENAFKALNVLKTMGITLSIDDFGTGYSSMAQLKKMPVHELKIDKAFVLDLAANKDDQVMVKTIISLAKNLGLKTVAEGVEDLDTLNLLEIFGCTKAQGFYLSKALPVAQFNQWYVNFVQNRVSG
ncbi:EAL domain-containing protein [Paraglaciecola sp. L3A3]|uniref:bifunctional diguanylate cyclase/phosphodiesterase n=1 Tax=Paraglaciecola sp. L3A3 TaxID=2686358 RepID=UPI001E530B2B|nr:EAL domain-containing protein [Paraglaciecola sp. L3A3]